jgi:iduronate 2-sulfatase
MGMPMTRCPVDVKASRAIETCTEGLSFAPVLAEPTRVWKAGSFSQYTRLAETVMGYTVRTEQWRFTRWVQFDKSLAGEQGGAIWNETLGVELYPHSPTVKPCDWDYEAHNVASDPTNAAVVAKLSQMLIDGWRSALPPGAHDL